MGLRGPHANAEQIERNRVIMERWLAGETLDSIGVSYGVTRERIRQICKKSQYNLSDSEKPDIVDRIISRRAGGSIMTQRYARQTARKALIDLFKTSFDRDQIISIMGLQEDADICAFPDVQLCELVYQSLNIRRFYKYIQCSACEDIKADSEFSPSAKRIANSTSRYCRACNTARHRQTMLDNPQHLQRMIERQKTRPNLQRIYTLRSYYRHQGRDSEMPPLPPKGTPDSDIKTPPKQPYGESLRKWRESVGRVFNRKKAVDKAKKLVRDDALSRHISI